ncbi:MAG: ribosome small subunit-dependent GTPase A [Patescibacteria group bacterium]|nr:ribosome small subunit-dependent GTPase A [Patescibacteria group bacterium]
MAIISKQVRQIADRRLAGLGFKISFGKHVLEQDEFSSSSVKSRVADLHQAFADKNVKAIYRQTKTAFEIKQIKNRFGGADVIFTSTVTQEGLDELKSYIAKGKTYCFLGSSGVGKSSLINKLIGGETIKTKGISLGTSRGKHTTTTREMYFLSGGGIVIDNPGMREVGLADAGAGVENVFEKITLLAQECKFTDCTHTHEPGCAVLLAVNSGKLDKGQYANFLNLKKETDYYEMTDFEKRKKDRDFGKFVKKAKKELKSYRNKF